MVAGLDSFRPRVCERRRPLPTLLLAHAIATFCFQFVGFVVLLRD